MLNLTPDRIATAALVWACSAAPALAAGLDVVALDSSFPLRDVLLYGSLGLLAVAVALRLNRRRSAGTQTAEGPDLRWWKHEDQHYMGA